MPGPNQQAGKVQNDGDSIAVTNIKTLRLGLSEFQRLQKRVDKADERLSGCIENTVDQKTIDLMERHLKAAMNRRDDHLAIVQAHACEALGLVRKP